MTTSEPIVKPSRTDALLEEFRGLLVSTCKTTRHTFEFPTYTAYDILRFREILLLIAPPKAGKSFIALELAWAVTTGTPFLGQYEVDEPGPVLYIAGEGADETLVRLEVLLRLRGADQLKSPLHLLPIPVDFKNLELVEILKDFSSELGVRLVIIDTVARCGAGDEGADHMGQFVQGVTAFRQGIDATVVLVHHTPISDGTRSRGHTSLPAAVDSQWLVKGKDVRSLHVGFGRSSTRGSDDDELAAFRIAPHVLGLNKHGREVGSGYVIPMDSTGDLISRARFLHKEKGASVRAIAEELAVPKSTVARWLKPPKEGGNGV